FITLLGGAAARRRAYNERHNLPRRQGDRVEANARGSDYDETSSPTFSASGGGRGGVAGSVAHGEGASLSKQTDQHHCPRPPRRASLSCRTCGRRAASRSLGPDGNR